LPPLQPADEVDNILQIPVGTQYDYLQNLQGVSEELPPFDPNKYPQQRSVVYNYVGNNISDKILTDIYKARLPYKSINRGYRGGRISRGEMIEDLVNNGILSWDEIYQRFVNNDVGSINEQLEQIHELMQPSFPPQIITTPKHIPQHIIGQNVTVFDSPMSGEDPLVTRWKIHLGNSNLFGEKELRHLAKMYKVRINDNDSTEDIIEKIAKSHAKNRRIPSSQNALQIVIESTPKQDMQDKREKIEKRISANAQKLENTKKQNKVTLSREARIEQKKRELEKQFSTGPLKHLAKDAGHPYVGVSRATMKRRLIDKYLKEYNEELDKEESVIKQQEEAEIPQVRMSLAERLASQQPILQQEDPGPPVLPPEEPEQEQQAEEQEQEQQAQEVQDRQEQEQVQVQEEPAQEHEQGGSGHEKRGLYDDEIQSIMRNYRNLGWKGVYSIDELDRIPVSDKMAFILNLDPSTKPGSHWVGVFIDTKKDKSLEYYDPLAKDPPKRFSEDIKGLIDKLDPDVYLKYKINKVKRQSDNTDTCGWHSMKWVMQRLNGVPWVDCSGWSEVTKSEKEIKKFKNSFGYI